MHFSKYLCHPYVSADLVSEKQLIVVKISGNNQLNSVATNDKKVKNMRKSAKTSMIQQKSVSVSTNQFYNQK